MSERIGVIRRALLLPADDLALEFTKAGYYGLGDDIKLGLALIYGIGPNAPRLIAVDDAGRLILGTSPLLGPVQIVDGTAVGGEKVASFSDSSSFSGATTLWNTSQLALFNGSANNHSMRDASQAVMNNKTGLGAILSTSPGQWAAVSTPAAGVVASATQAAGGAGVRHICSGILVTYGAIAAPVATALTWNLRDGATGVGTILASGQIAVPAAVFQGQPIMLSDLAIVGSAATAMTLEFSAALANLLEGCTLIGWDAN